MRKILIALLITLCLLTNLNAEKESKTLWDQVENKCIAYGLAPYLDFKDDGEWTFRGNEDYEKLIDVMMSTLMITDLPVEPEWYEKTEYILLLGFIAGFFTAK